VTVAAGGGGTGGGGAGGFISISQVFALSGGDIKAYSSSVKMR
jgi:hypothetical protein